MNHISIWVILVSFLLIFHTSHSVNDSVKISLLNFLAKLTSQNGQIKQNLGWNSLSDPCKDSWVGVVCDRQNVSVRKLYLDGLNLSGTLQTSHLCNSKPLMDSLIVLSIKHNNITGEIPADIENCKQLTQFLAVGNRFSGNLPSSFAKLVNLKKLDFSYNFFSGNLPDLSRISGLTVFLAEKNQFTGEIPQFEFSNFEQFNVSFNNFTGQIPIMASSYFSASSFLGNLQLCGAPLPRKCQSLKLEEAQPKEEESKHNKDAILMYAGYIVLALILILIVTIKLCKGKKKEKNIEASSKVVSVVDDDINNFDGMSSEYKTSKSEFSMRSMESSHMPSSSLIVLTNPVVNGLKFEDLLKAPAELVGRGKNGSLYKVMFGYGMVFAVKRIKDWEISTDDFMKRMWKIDQVKHPNVLPALAFYSSDLEKLLVYEYQPNGSLFSLLHGNQSNRAFDWTSRLEVAATIANTLAYMHKTLQNDEIGHGNLKSSNILINRNMEPCVSEYGLMEITNQHNISTPNINSSAIKSNSFKSDVYGFGVILLELLTGKHEQNEEGIDLTEWVRTVLREEWTVEVFDRSLMEEPASQERMVSLLQVAVQCVEHSPNSRPSIKQVASMVNAIKEEEEEEEEGEGNSIVSEI